MSLLTKRVRGSMKFSRSCHYKASHYLWEYDGRFEELFVGMEVLGSTHLYDTHESQTNIHIVLIAVFGCSARSDIFLILQLSRRESRRFSRGVSRKPRNCRNLPQKNLPIRISRSIRWTRFWIWWTYRLMRQQQQISKRKRRRPIERLYNLNPALQPKYPNNKRNDQIIHSDVRSGNSCQENTRDGLCSWFTIKNHNHISAVPFYLSRKWGNNRTAMGR